MKKIVKRTDGSEEIIEGTPGELAEFERKIRSEELTEVPQKKGKKILLSEDLKGEIIESIKKAIDECFLKRPEPQRDLVTFHSHCVGCFFCRPPWLVIQPIPSYPTEYPGITWGWTSDRVDACGQEEFVFTGDGIKTNLLGS